MPKILREIPPNEILSTNETQSSLFETDLDEESSDKTIKVSPAFLEIAETAPCVFDGKSSFARHS